jgi:putative flippase GtrA
VSALLRWCRFNLVGAMGVMVQLGALAMLNRCLPGHYLLVTGVAVELAVLHNFLWHVRYTWADRCADGLWITKMVRFHLSNGFVSIAGNLTLMHVLVGQMHTPVVVANVVAIVCCGLVSFSLGERWVFAAKAES